MNSRDLLPPKGRALLAFLVSEIKSGRVQKHAPKTFIPYSEVALALGITDPDIYPGRKLQREGLNDLNEWTKATSGIPQIAGLIVNKDSRIPSEGFPESHGFQPGQDWESWWLKETAAAIEFDWSPYL